MLRDCHTKRERFFMNLNDQRRNTSYREEDFRVSILLINMLQKWNEHPDAMARTPPSRHPSSDRTASARGDCAGEDFLWLTHTHLPPLSKRQESVCGAWMESLPVSLWEPRLPEVSSSQPSPSRACACLLLNVIELYLYKIKNILICISSIFCSVYISQLIYPSTTDYIWIVSSYFPSDYWWYWVYFCTFMCCLCFFCQRP